MTAGYILGSVAVLAIIAAVVVHMWPRMRPYEAPVVVRLPQCEATSEAGSRCGLAAGHPTLPVRPWAGLGITAEGHIWEDNSDHKPRYPCPGCGIRAGFSAGCTSTVYGRGRPGTRSATSVCRCCGAQ